MRKKIAFFILIFVSFLVLGNVKVNAAVDTTQDVVVIGAQIRTTGNAGIRFVGKMYEESSLTPEKYGIVLAFGEALPSDDFVINGTVNAKQTVYAEVDSLDPSGQFYVTLYNVPESFYTQDITARAFVVDDGVYIYSDEVVTISLYQVAKALEDQSDAFVNNIIAKSEYEVNFIVNGGVIEDSSYTKTYPESITTMTIGKMGMGGYGASDTLIHLLSKAQAASSSSSYSWARRVGITYDEEVKAYVVDQLLTIDGKQNIQDFATSDFFLIVYTGAENNAKVAALNLGNVVVFDQDITKLLDGDINVTLTSYNKATFEINYKKTFASKGATLPVPTKQGYLFNGWKNASSETVTSVSSATTLYADWVSAFEINYHTNGGKLAGTYEVNYNSEKNSVKLGAFNTGYFTVCATSIVLFTNEGIGTQGYQYAYKAGFTWDEEKGQYVVNQIIPGGTAFSTENKTSAYYLLAASDYAKGYAFVSGLQVGDVISFSSSIAGLEATSTLDINCTLESPLVFNCFNTGYWTDAVRVSNMFIFDNTGAVAESYASPIKVGIVYDNDKGAYVVKQILPANAAFSEENKLSEYYLVGSTEYSKSNILNTLEVGDVIVTDRLLSTLVSTTSANVIIEVYKADTFNITYSKGYEGTVNLPIPTKDGYDFGGWYTTSDFQGDKVTEYTPSLEENELTLYARWLLEEEALISLLLDSVSDVVSSTTIDELPGSIEGYTVSWTSSNPDLYKIVGMEGYTSRVYQTHKTQKVTVSVSVTASGKTYSGSKEIQINPVLFDDMTNPACAYFAVSSTTSYMTYNERYKADGTMFSDKFKNNMDMVYYSFAVPQSDGSLTLNTNYLEQVIALKENGIRVLLVIDGANAAPLKAMVQLCDDDTTRATFVRNIINLVVTHNFDGVDVDWEFPGTSGLDGYTTEKDRANLNKLLRDLRTALNNEQDLNGSPYILSVATPPTNWGTDRYDFDGRYDETEGINGYCDYVNMMSYDLNKTSNASHQTQLYNPTNSYSYKFGCDYGVSYYTSLGLSKSKIILGTAAYGKAYNLTGESPDATYPGLGATGTLGQVLGYNLPLQSISWASGTIYYTGIQMLIDSGNFIQYNEINANGEFVGSYLYSSKDNVFITFDSIYSVTQKCEYAKANGLGVMVWAYGEDATDTIVNTICDNIK